MWFELDLHETRTVSGLALDTTSSPADYPRGYVVRLSTDGEGWVEVARQAQNNRALEVRFSPRAARYIRVEQTGRASDWWWSIHGVTVSSDPFTPSPTARASHNNVQAGADNLAQALDGRPETRWSSRSLQEPGMWFELDLHETRTVSGLALDTTSSPADYPRGYALEVSFSPQAARYIRIEQTGRASDWWWSIHGVTIVD
jgi:hypothetical protein